MTDFINRAKSSLHLNKDNGWILGVCAGFARFLQIDDAIVRVVVIIAALFFPKLMIASYLVIWLLLDDRPNPKRDYTADRER